MWLELHAMVNYVLVDCVKKDTTKATSLSVSLTRTLRLICCRPDLVVVQRRDPRDV